MKIKIDEMYIGMRVDKALAQITEKSRSFISDAIDSGKIRLENRIIKNSYKIQGDEIFDCDIEKEEQIEEIKAQDINLDIVYEDEYLAIIDKPYNMIVHPTQKNITDTLVNAIMYKFDKLSDINQNGYGIVHRLDKDTSGLLIIAKTNEAHEKLSQMFKDRQVHKTYLAILKGKFTKSDYKIESYIGRDKKDRKKISHNTNKGRLAISIFTSLKYTDDYTLAKINILTGRTHQIRVHSKQMGLSVAGDKVYSKKDNFKRQQLHSYILDFIHPITLNRIYIKSDIPSDMLNNIIKLGLEVDYAGI